MEFDKVRIENNSVELNFQRELLAGGKETATATGKDPTPRFKGALAAFTSYVGWVHSLPEVVVDRIEVRSVSIKRPEDQPRGIVVTGLLKCPRARSSTSTLNTPYLAEPPENYSGDRTGFLPAEIVDFIDELEAEATLFHDGERGEQTKLPLGDENVSNVNDRMASAEIDSTKKPRRGKKDPNAGKPEVHQVKNPDSTEPPLNDEEMRQLLLSVDRDVPIDAFPTLIRSERLDVERWARSEQRRLTKSLHPGETTPDEPEWVKKSATLPLTADEWTGDPPPKASEVDAVAIQDAARG